MAAPTPERYASSRTLSFALPLNWPPTQPILIVHAPDKFTFDVLPSGQLRVLLYFPNQNGGRVDEFISQPIAFTSADGQGSGETYPEALITFQMTATPANRTAGFTVNGVGLQHNKRTEEVARIPLGVFTLHQPIVYSTLPQKQVAAVPLWRDRLFLFTLQELEVRGQARTEYDLIKCSGLLRLLIGEPTQAESLAVQIAEAYALPLVFQVAELSEMSIPLLLANRYPAAPLIELSLSELLTHPALQLKEGIATIHHLLKALAETRGGIHFGEPKTGAADKKRVTQHDEQFIVTYPSSQTQLWQVTQIVLQACQPLMKAVLEAPKISE